MKHYCMAGAVNHVSHTHTGMRNAFSWLMRVLHLAPVP